MGISRRLYNQVMLLDNFTCVYCGRRGPDMAADHYIPRSLGGPDVLQNLVTACQYCNTSKQDRAPYEWKKVAQYGRFAYVRAALGLPDPSKETKRPHGTSSPRLQPRWNDKEAMLDTAFRAWADSLEGKELIQSIRGARAAGLDAVADDLTTRAAEAAAQLCPVLSSNADR